MGGVYRSVTTTPFLWTGGRHFGDWLALDAPSGSHKGSTREDFIASAFYAHSCALLAKTGRILGRDMREYEELHSNIVVAFRQAFPSCHTQTEHVLAVQFGLAEDPQKTADALAEPGYPGRRQNRTGFVRTPYILHVLSDYGHTELAYSLLLRKEYPSWLYSVEKGATTMWEHWDSILEDGGFWSNDMNSFNHYAYGSVIDWIYEKAAGIRVLEEYPGFSRVRIQPLPDKRLGWLEALWIPDVGESIRAGAILRIGFAWMSALLFRRLSCLGDTKTWLSQEPTLSGADMHSGLTAF